MSDAITQPKTGFSSYLAVARIDHWFKNVFMIPGVAFALAFSPESSSLGLVPVLVLAFLSTSLIASANYTINEWLDAEFDRQHPTKKHRPAAAYGLSGRLIWTQWFVLATTGLLVASSINAFFQLFALTFLVMGLAYNVEPVRTKDRAYLDVVSESFNNPLRFMLGWSAVISTVMPPSSIVIAYWMGGAFLMAIKRFAEYRFINDPERAGRYRRSFKVYTEESLLLSAFFYAMSSCLFLGVFLIKHRIEFLFLFPLVAILFVWYLKIGLQPDSVVQRPEKLYTQKGFMAYVAFFVLSILVLSFLDMPWMSFLLNYQLIWKA